MRDGCGKKIIFKSAPRPPAKAEVSPCVCVCAPREGGTGRAREKLFPARFHSAAPCGRGSAVSAGLRRPRSAEGEGVPGGGCGSPPRAGRERDARPSRRGGPPGKAALYPPPVTEGRRSACQAPRGAPSMISVLVQPLCLLRGLKGLICCSKTCVKFPARCSVKQAERE